MHKESPHCYLGKFSACYRKLQVRQSCGQAMGCSDTAVAHRDGHGLAPVSTL